MAEKRTVYKIKDAEGIGEVHISDEVIAMIAALAATDAEGVAVNGNSTKELRSRPSMKNLSKGVVVSFEDAEDGSKKIRVTTSIQIKFGYNILEVSENVQEKVKTALLTMTGLECLSVNVKVSGIEFGE